MNNKKVVAKKGVRGQVVAVQQVNSKRKVVINKIVFQQRGKADVEFEKQINMWCAIALFFIFAWLFTFLPLTHQLGENNRLREYNRILDTNYVQVMEQCTADKNLLSSQLEVAKHKHFENCTIEVNITKVNQNG